MKSWGLFVSNFYEFAQNSRLDEARKHDEASHPSSEFHALSCVSYLPFCRARKIQQIWFIYEKGREKWWKIFRRSFSIRQISPAAHHARKNVQTLPLLHQRARKLINYLIKYPRWINSYPSVHMQQIFIKIKSLKC